jgi:hypothetical protein
LWTSAKPYPYTSDTFSNTSRGDAHSDADWYSRNTHSSTHSNTYPYSHSGTYGYSDDLCLCARPLLYLELFFQSDKGIR